VRTSSLARLLTLAVVLAATSGHVSSRADSSDGPRPVAGWTAAARGYPWSFPRDHSVHRGYRIEWWYLTGHLSSRAEPGQRFGFQFTVFRIGLDPGSLPWASDWTASHLLMGHAAITDKTGRRHAFSELLVRETPLLGGFADYPDPRIAWARGPAGTDGPWSLRWNGEAFDVAVRDDAQGIAFELATRPAKPLVLQAQEGYSRKSDAGEGAASLYYSFTRLDTQGTLELGGTTYVVRGQSWMDHEFSTGSLAERQVGWDWFGLQLDDGREVMLYVLRGADGGTDFARGTMVDRDGEARYLAAESFRVEAHETWTSPETGSTYPARWTVEIPSTGIVLDVRPDVANQEDVGRLAGRLRYWEGAVTLRDGQGRPVGSGYVELTGYGEENRPPV